MVKKKRAPTVSSKCVGTKMSKRSFGSSKDVTAALKKARTACKVKKYKVVKKRKRKTTRKRR